MPTIEFHGYKTAERTRLLRRLRGALKEVPFRADIVFVLGAPTRVVGWEGSSRPFVRLLSRSPARLRELTLKVLPFSDVETVRIGFSKRAE